MDISPIQLAKQELRQQMLARKSQLTSLQVRGTSDCITHRIIQSFNWHNATSVHIYRSVESWREVDTSRLITTLKSDHPHLLVDIAGTAPNQPNPIRQHDYIIVPVVAFDMQHNRLGMGAGWYDIFLATQSKAITIGLAYGWSKQPLIPHEPHDIKLRRTIYDQT